MVGPKSYKQFIYIYFYLSKLDGYALASLCSAYFQESEEQHDNTLVVVIMNEPEFRYRVRKAATKLGYDCVFGDVNYHAATNRGEPVAGNMLHLIRRDEIDINKLASENNVIEHYDCFDKWDKHAYQREWRICLNRNTKEISPYRKVYFFRFVRWCRAGHGDGSNAVRLRKFMI